MTAKQGHLTDEKVQSRLRSQQKDRQQRIGIAMQTLMSHPEGRFVIHYLAYTLLGLEAVCLDPVERNSALFEGRRWGAKLIRELATTHASPGDVALMLSEAAFVEKQDNETTKAAKVETEEEDTDA